MEENKEYTTPELIVYGNVEELTEGPWGGRFDSIWGGDGGFNPCVNGPLNCGGGSGS